MQQSSRSDITRTVNNIFTIERDDIAFSCVAVCGGWQVMVHVCDLTENVPLNSVLDQKARIQLCGNLFPVEVIENMIFSKSMPRNAITTTWKVSSEDFSVSTPAVTSSMITLGDKMTRSQGELIVNGQRVDVVSYQSSHALRTLCDITRRLEYLRHPNRLESHQSRVVSDVNGKLVEMSDLMKCIKMCRFWTIEANAAAARFLSEAFSEATIFYRQPPPDGWKMNTFRKDLKASHDISLDCTDKRTIRDSMYARTDPHEIKKVSIGISRLPHCAMYILGVDIPKTLRDRTEKDFGHWNHDERYYTNYTNAFTRYIDIVIQRAIVSALFAGCVNDMIAEHRELCSRTNKLMQSQRAEQTRVSMQAIAFDMEAAYGRVSAHVFVKGMTIEADHAYVNLECLDPSLKFPIASLKLSKTKPCDPVQIEFNKAQGYVLIQTRTQTMPPIKIGLMNELYVILQQVEGKIAASLI